MIETRVCLVCLERPSGWPSTQQRLRFLQVRFRKTLGSALQISAQGIQLLSFSPHGEVSVSTPCWYSKGQKVYKAVSLEMLGTDHDLECVQVGELGRLASEGYVNGY